MVVGKVGSHGSMAVVMVDRVVRILCVEFAADGYRWNLWTILVISQVVGFDGIHL